MSRSAGSLCHLGAISTTQSHVPSFPVAATSFRLLVLTGAAITVSFIDSSSLGIEHTSTGTGKLNASNGLQNLDFLDQVFEIAILPTLVSIDATLARPLWTE